jgi:hypothetical protein
MTEETSPSLLEMDRRLKKLESTRWEKWTQSAFIPVVLLLLGTCVNRTLQEQNQLLQRTDVAQKMLPGMFDGNAVKAYATVRLMRYVVDSAMAHELDSVVTAFYAQKAKESLDAQQPDSAAAILSAARTVGGSRSAASLNAALGVDGVDSVRRLKSRADTVRVLERKGFLALERLEMQSAQTAFRDAERVYPGFRISYEMERLLSRAVKDPGQTNSVIREALRLYSGFMPAETVTALRARLDGA